MEEYIYSEVTDEDIAVLEAEEMADQAESAGLDDDLVENTDDVTATSDDEGLEPAAASDDEGLEPADAESTATDGADDDHEDAIRDDEETPVLDDDAESDEDVDNLEENTETAEGNDQDTPAGNGSKKRSTLVRVIGVRFRTAGKAYYFSPGPYEVGHGRHVIVETARGVEYGTVVTLPMEIDRRKVKSPIREILRPATSEDDAAHQENRRKEREAYRVCFKKIREHQLDMKLIDAEYTFDHSKILFYFTADGRVDFRDLVKDLAGIFKTRIELRQIGVRDETKILGGYGSCGRPLCCHTYLSDFVPVSIKMAKEQNLSLNPAKISGVCGRLMCCLKNEAETYEELNRNLPRQGDEVEGPDGLQGEVESVNVLRQKVRILVEIDDEKEIHEYNADEITMIRRRKRGEAKHRSKRIENGQESADELRKTSRKGRSDRVVHTDDAERPARGGDTERQPRDNDRQTRGADQERPARGSNERPTRGGDHDRAAQNNDAEHPVRNEGSGRSSRGDNGDRGAQGEGQQERRERRRSDRRPGQGRRGSREDRENAAQERGGRENGQNRGGRGRRDNRDNREDRQGDAGDNRENRENRDNREERQGGGRGNNHRRRGRGHGDRRDGQAGNNESRSSTPTTGGEG